MPTFCRHNRFIERCPICSKTLPEHSAGARPARSARPARAPSAARTGGAGRSRGESLRVHREGRAPDDGYRSALLPGVHASADAIRLAQEIAFAAGRLLALAAEPPGLYGEARALAASDPEAATWMCFLISYLCPLEGEDPFAGIRLALARGPVPDLEGVPLGPRTSHDSRARERHAARLPPLGRAAGGRVLRRSELEPASTLRAAVRAARAARLRADGPL